MTTIAVLEGESPTDYDTLLGKSSFFRKAVKVTKKAGTAVNKGLKAVPVVNTAYQASKAVAYTGTGRFSKAKTATKLTARSAKGNALPVALVTASVFVPSLAPMATQSLLSKTKLPFGVKVKKPTLSNMMQSLAPTNLFPTQGSNFNLIKKTASSLKSNLTPPTPSSNFSELPAVEPKPYTNPFPASDFTATVSTQPTAEAKSAISPMIIGIGAVAVLGVVMLGRKK